MKADAIAAAVRAALADVAIREVKMFGIGVMRNGNMPVASWIKPARAFVETLAPKRKTTGEREKDR